MTKIDFKKTLKHLYVPSAKDFALVDVPDMTFVKVDGHGAPGNDAYQHALSWLYPVSYGLKFYSKQTLAKDYVVPPLEGLWWADDMTAYTDDRRDEWHWTLMIMLPDWLDDAAFNASVEKASKKLGDPPATLRREVLHEGLCAQIMHIGPYSEEGPTIARLHKEYLPQNGLTENGHHHEIYLSDPRKTAPEKLRTVLRHPVRRL